MARKPPIRTKGWEHYDIGDINTATATQLQAAVRKAAKAANQRLVRLEKAGKTRGIYQTAMGALEGRKRFKERPNKLTLPQLRREYANLRTFLSSKSSTVSGQSDIDEKRYQTAVNRGYKGTIDDFYTDINRLYNKENEKLFSSEVIYQAILTGQTDIVSAIIEDTKRKILPRNRGDTLKDFLRRRQEYLKKNEDKP